MTTGTEVARTEPLDDQLDPVERRHLAALWKQSQRLAGSGLVPDALHGKPNDVMAVVLFGEQYGLAPAHAVSQLWIIKGRIVPSSQVLSGVAMRAGHEVRIEESSSERCTVAIRRKGTDYWQRATWTIEDARRAKLAEKELWKSYTADMLAHATIRRAVKRICPDVLLGIDDGGDDGRAVDEVLAERGVERLKGGGDKVVEVALDDDPDDIVDAEIIDPVTQANYEEGLIDEDDVENLTGVRPASRPDPAEGRARAQRGLMAQATSAFPPNGDLPTKERRALQTAQRHAVAYAVLGEHKSANDMTIDELVKVTYWLRDVEEGRVRVFQRDGTWLVEFNGGQVEVPPESPTAA